MSRSRDRLSEAAANARAIRSGLAADVRAARLSAGISQAAAGAAVRLSKSQFGRFERGELADLSVEQACRACAAVGLKFAGRAYPDGDAVRDTAQLTLLRRFSRELPGSVAWRTEVPLSRVGDLRAWDGEAIFPDGRIKVEAETRLRDLQAIDRRIALKQRDDDVDTVILLINDTPANRAVLREHRDGLRARFPADAAEILKMVRIGRAPRTSGLLFL